MRTSPSEAAAAAQAAAPWLIGQASRIECLEAVLERVAAMPQAWIATTGDIVAAWQGSEDGGR